uniref:DNA-binding domain protein n=1 Tax=Phage sp. ctXnn1 TaxID=2826749 RepID=A0A8S5NAH5_9VIRU|nr:MAG TPA: DNA-binding domain protein [Phage sp. ctXnn1]
MTRDSMVFYSSFAEAIKLMPKEQQLEALWAIIDYGLDDTAPDQNANAMAKVIFQMAKPQIDANVKRKANGMMGGRPKNNGFEDEKPMVIESENHRLEAEKPNVNVNDNVNDTKENTLKGVKEKRFAPPTPENVREYCREMGYTHVDANRFVDFYSAKGWMVGKSKMKDWKAAVRNWERQDKGQRQGVTAKVQNTNRFKNFTERQYNQSDYDKIIFGELAKPRGEEHT